MKKKTYSNYSRVTARSHYTQYMRADDSAATVQSYNEALRQMERYWGRDILTREITDSVLDDFVDWCQRQGKKLSTAEKLKQRIRSIARNSEPMRIVNRASPKARQSSPHKLAKIIEQSMPDNSLRWFLRKVYRVHRVNCGMSNLLQMDGSLRILDCWHGSPVMLSDLSDDLLLRFMQYRTKTGLMASTVNNDRRRILAVWNLAWRKRYVEVQPRDIPTLREYLPSPEGFTIEQVEKLIAAAEELPGNLHKSKVPRRLYWPALIRFGYDTGLRRGDCLTVERSQIPPSGLVTITQLKTGNPVTVKVHPSTVAAIDRLPVFAESAAVFHWTMDTSYFARHFRALGKLAGIEDAKFKMLRRTSGSYVEATHLGMGGRHLGHRSPQVFAKHYEDPRVSRAEPPMPPELKVG